MKYEDLKILDQLREKGSITEEEYQREKAKILNETTSSSTSSGSKPLFGLEENTYLMLMHVSQLLGLLIPSTIITLMSRMVVPISTPFLYSEASTTKTPC